MARIFISYRREDSDIWVSRLVEELRKHFPPDQVFQDIASIDPGADFKEALDKALATAAVMLAVIGRGWLSATDKQGRRRLDLPTDFVRQEIAESLRRSGVRVFPILVNGAEMPSEEDLPDPLKALHLRQAFELTVRHWHQDVAQLVQTLKRVPSLSDDQRVDQDVTRQRAEQETKRHEAEERAAQEESGRVAAEEQAKKEADEEGRRRTAEEEARRKAAEEEAQRKAAEEARRRAEEESKRREAEERAAQEESERIAGEEQAKKEADEEARRNAEEEARRKAEQEDRRRLEEEARRKATQEEARRKAGEEDRRRGEEEARRKAAEEEARRKAAEEAGVQLSKPGWKAVVGIGALVGAVALVVFFSGGERPKPSPAPSTAQPVPSPHLEQPSAAPSPPAAATPASKQEALMAKEALDDMKRFQAQQGRDSHELDAEIAKQERLLAETQRETTALATQRRGLVARRPGEVFRDCDQCPEMVVVPAGEFMLGSPESEKDRYKREGPRHTVTIARPFAVGKYEVTFDEWDACVAAGSCKNKPDDKGWGRGRRPVINVSWQDAQAYAAWLSEKTGKPYRLLSEAEWEYAARAGTTTRYPWGDEPGTNRANFDGSGSKWSGKRTAPVGSFDPNKFGLHDMIGNVVEWVQDCSNDSYKGAPEDGSARESGDCGLRVVRGGSWSSFPVFARVAYRVVGVEPAGRYDGFGFRVARTL